MKILLTGATGFIGSHLVKALLRDGYDVIILKRSFSDTFRINDILESVISVNVDTCSVADIFKTHPELDTVIHTATHYGNNVDDINATLEANLQLPMQLLQHAKIFINTDTFLNPRSGHLKPYTLSKQQFIEWGRLFAEETNVHFINAKLELVYGPLDNRNKFLPSVLSDLLK